MANLDYAGQLTQIYNKLVALDASMAKLALRSEMNTAQTSIMADLNTILGQIQSITYQLSQLDLTMTNLLAELRSK